VHGLCDGDPTMVAALQLAVAGRACLTGIFSFYLLRIDLFRITKKVQLHRHDACKQKHTQYNAPTQKSKQAAHLG